MKYYRHTIVFQEMPSEVSLLFEITQCPHRCRGCHSPHLQEDVGVPLEFGLYKEIVEKYRGYATNVMFFGGDQFEEELIPMLEYAQMCGLKTTLWTGASFVSERLMRCLTFLKTGKYVPELGGLKSATTNQRYVEVSTGRSIVLGG